MRTWISFCSDISRVRRLLMRCYTPANTMCSAIKLPNCLATACAPTTICRHCRPRQHCWHARTWDRCGGTFSGRGGVDSARFEAGEPVETAPTVERSVWETDIEVVEIPIEVIVYECPKGSNCCERVPRHRQRKGKARPCGDQLLSGFFFRPFGRSLSVPLNKQ